MVAWGEYVIKDIIIYRKGAPNGSGSLLAMRTSNRMALKAPAVVASMCATSALSVSSSGRISPSW
jgi:hypothetical protein